MLLEVIIMVTLEAVIFSRVSSDPQGISGNVWRGTSGCLTGKGCYWQLGVEPRGVAKHPAVHRAAPHSKHCPA